MFDDVVMFDDVARGLSWKTYMEYMRKKIINGRLWNICGKIINGRNWCTSMIPRHIKHDEIIDYEIIGLEIIN